MNVKFLALFLLLPLFVHAGWIDSYSFDQAIGGNEHKLTLYSSPQVVNDGDAWRYFTKSKSYNFTWGYSGTTLQLNWTNQGRNLSVAFNKFCPVCSPYQLNDNNDKFDLWFNATIPAGAQGTYTFTFPSGFGNYWIPGSTCFSGANLTFCYPDWNKNHTVGNNTIFNSSFDIWMNPVTRQIQTNITFACWTNSSCFETFDPVITQTSSMDEFFQELSGQKKAYSFLKFMLSSIPTNVTINYAELNMLFFAGGPSTYVMSPVSNSTRDWNYANTSAQMTGIAMTPVGNSSNVSYDGAHFANGSIKKNYWLPWNVTNATIWAYSQGLNSTYIINETIMIAISAQNLKTFLTVGAAGVCTDTDCAWSVNSSRATDSFPHLDVYYQYNVPQWDSPGYNTTVQGQLTKLFVHWTGNSLGNYFFELDNGNGTNQNYTGTISGIDNWTNYTFYDNQGSNSTVHFRVYQTDSISGGMNVSPLTTFQITPITVKNQPSTVIMLSNTSNETFIYSLMVVIIAVALLLRRKGNSA